MEARVEQVVGWLQRKALWLAGSPMILQTKTILNKVFTRQTFFALFVASSPQHPSLSTGWVIAAQQQKLSASCKLSMRKIDRCRL
ncbi:MULTISPECIES: hypothetical protein [Hydrogenophaga]|jgi:hypothetical protein|uniref:hypothetical protein n=1 Tax=Hydrogenophaga TaxID=47420 RepID=UPI000FD8E09E|nr:MULTISPECIES: hypothetical protein [Hydrogenophaga]